MTGNAIKLVLKIGNTSLNETNNQDIHDGFNFAAAGTTPNLDGRMWQQKAIFEKCQEFYFNPSLIPSLGFFCDDDHKNKDGSNRLHREELRLSVSKILCAISLKLDFATSQIGTPTKNGDFNFATHKEIAEIAGLVIHSDDSEDLEFKGVSQKYGRAWRFILKNSKHFGQIERFHNVPVTQRNGTVVDETRGVSAIKFVDLKLFVEMGALTWKQVEHVKSYSKSLRASMPSRRHQAAKERAKVYKRKPRMSTRIAGIYKDLSANMDKLYNYLKSAFPDCSEEWYRDKVLTAFPQ